MPRPKKFRRVCCLPVNNVFAPARRNANAERVIMSVDEYETIRLIDFERFTQQECSEKMNIARTTVQSIYDNARKKVADCLVNGKTLVIEGGDYLLCDGQRIGCNQRGCHRHRFGNKGEI